MGNWISTIELEGTQVKLVPLNTLHKEGLLRAAADGKLWELWYTSVPSKSNIDNYIDNALGNQNMGTALPFTIIDKSSDEIIGSTRYCNVSCDHRRLEIGYTWYAKKHQRTGVNTECKYLLLKHAFEDLNCISVQFRTNWYNLQSRRAIERLGAKQDGVLRNHQLNPDGSMRDTVVFSIIEQEWQGVKKLLEYKMNKYKT
ncbi:GNAT family protein [Fulvivirgaceae bacterium BMA10]|uniref:GNAT family protein n=1 Tax=Splendidivirga corallicola TaxID=3051826 RepID=A0ABT8KWW8_9BACT|nr:GNAT family protein [Fulvivirgaceae bacterium BMA10]